MKGICLSLLILMIGILTIKEVNAETIRTVQATLPSNETYEVVFPDSVLSKAVALAATGTEDTSQIVTQADLNKITTLSIDDTTNQVSSLEGVQYLARMTRLNADNQNIIDLTPIEGLTSLTWLEFDNNANLEDISALYPLTRLEYVLLSNTKVKDLTPLYNYYRHSLTQISLENNDLYNEDINPVLAQIKANDGNNQLHLFLKGNHLTDYSQIRLFGGIHDVTNQTYTLPTIKVGQELTSSNIVYGATNQLIEPSFISNNGDYLEPFISWDGTDLADYPTEVSYSWEGFGTEFSGIVIQPLMYIKIQADNAITYPKKTVKTEAEFLNEIHATTNDGSPISSDFASVVDFNTPGAYDVTLNAQDSSGLIAFPVKVQVTVSQQEVPVIMADTEVSYTQGETKTEADFLQDIHASTNDGSSISSDFNTTVNLNKTGDYQVTLNATNADGTPATPVQVTVHVTANTATVISADKEITYKQNIAKSESQFLVDIHAKTNDGSKITSDFNQVVNLEKLGDYRVKLVSTSASPVYVTVHITKSAHSDPDKPSTNSPVIITTGENDTKAPQQALPTTGDSTNNLIFVLAGIFLISYKRICKLK